MVVWSTGVGCQWIEEIFAHVIYIGRSLWMCYLK